jgi:hypothetical protein
MLTIGNSAFLTVADEDVGDAEVTSKPFTLLPYEDEGRPQYLPGRVNALEYFERLADPYGTELTSAGQIADVSSSS